MATIRINYSKPGATFTDAYAARADKNQFFPPELQQQVNDSDAQLLLDGIITQEVEYFWDQTTFQYTRQLKVNSLQTYWNSMNYDKHETRTLAEQAGWTFDGVIVVP